MSNGGHSRRRFLGHAGAAAGASFVAARASSQETGADARPTGPPVLRHPAYELDDGQASDPAEWASVEPGLHVSFASKDSGYARHAVPRVSPAREHSATAWRGERVNVLALAWASENVAQVRAVPGPLRSDKGAVIPAENVRVRFVRYVASDHAFASLETGCDESKASPIWLVPDLLDPLPRMDLEARTTRPLWVSVDVPPDAQPGRYAGQLKVAGTGGGAIPLRVNVEVQAPVLPEPARWSFRLDLWQNPWAVAHHHGLQPWSRPHLDVLRPHLRMLASAGAKFVTTYVCHSPWKDDTYVADGTMVEWIRKPDGTWAFDYSILDTYVELAGECGLKDSITCYTMVPWKNRVRYLDAVTGDYAWQEWPPRSEDFKAFWGSFLADLRRHLVQKGWFGRSYMGINENELEDSLASIRVLEQDSAQWKVTYAGGWHPELDDLIDDYCVIIDGSLSPDDVRRRRHAGRTTTFYVCCHPPRPNNFVFSPPAESAWMGWYASAFGYDGFLRWAYDSWTGDPARDARHASWPAGDCFLVYPGARSSIRFERLREGIVDFEKLRVLRGLLGERQGRVADTGEELSAILRGFDYRRAQTDPAAVPVQAGRRLLDDLTRRLFARG
jgi:Domain of unknown function (DUF4091)